MAKFHEPKLETPSLFKIDDELRSRLSLSKYDMMSSKGKRSVKGGMTPSKTARLTNEEKEMLKLQKMETFLKERMKPAWQWTYTHEPESMVDGSDVCAKIDSSRAKVVANDKRRARIEESNRQKRNNSALDRLMQAIGPGNEEQRVALDPKGGYFIEDEAKIPVIKPAVEKMPGGIQNPVKVHVSKE